MSTAIVNRLLNGGSVKYHRAQDQGIERAIPFEMGVNAVVQKLKLIAGDDFKLAGTDNANLADLQNPAQQHTNVGMLRNSNIK